MGHDPLQVREVKSKTTTKKKPAPGKTTGGGGAGVPRFAADVAADLDGKTPATRTRKGAYSGEFGVDEQETLSELLVRAMMEQPHLLAGEISARLRNDLTPVLAGLSPSDPGFNDVYDTYWGFMKLVLELRAMDKDSKTTAAQRARVNKLHQVWTKARDGIEARNLRATRARLREAAAGAQKLRLQMVFAYRDIYNAGQKPEDVKVGWSDVKGLAEAGTNLMKAINEADAAMAGRKVTPLIPVLDKTLTVVNLITGWKVTSGLASQSQKGMAQLQNALNLAQSGLSLTGFGTFLPMFAHIGPLLDGIAKGWDRIVTKLQEQNRLWWQLRDEFGEDVQYPDALPGGASLLKYMKAVFRSKSPLQGRPPDEVVDFFNKNREMFTATAKQVMGSPLGGIPTESSWLFWDKVDADELNDWVFYNREMAWRLIYGRGWDFPE